MGENKCNAECLVEKNKSRAVISEEWQEPWDEGGL